MRHGSLFSGIGGSELAAEWMGWKNEFHCEINPFGQKILKYYWPKATTYENIKTTDFSVWRGKIDILTGGFPCQPYSTTGLRKGKEDERHLWPEMLRAIREIKPRWIVGENVFGIVNWNGGMVFEEVQADLEAEGYKVQAYVLPAAAVNAPHRRDRVWFVAYSNISTERSSRKSCETERNRSHNNDEQECWPESSEFNTGCHGLLRCNTVFEHWATQSPVCDGNDGLSSRLDAITFPKWRTESIKAGGNAIVPQVIHQIFKTIEQYEK